MRIVEHVVRGVDSCCFCGGGYGVLDVVVVLVFWVRGGYVEVFIGSAVALESSVVIHVWVTANPFIDDSLTGLLCACVTVLRSIHTCQGNQNKQDDYLVDAHLLHPSDSCFISFLIL